MLDPVTDNFLKGKTPCSCIDNDHSFVYGRK